MATVDWQAVEAAIGRLQADWTDALAEFCAIPSEGGRADDLERAAQWTTERLERIGATTRVIRIDDAPPLVVGEIGPSDAPVLNLVQHYDVQPAGDHSEWTTPPYAPEVRDGRLYARGAMDNKGEVLVRMWALDALAAAGVELPCRVRFLVEGEEETGSSHLDALLDTDPELRRADAALGEGGGIDEQGRPIVEAGVRGILMVELSSGRFEGRPLLGRHDLPERGRSDGRSARHAGRAGWRADLGGPPDRQAAPDRCGPRLRPRPATRMARRLPQGVRLQPLRRRP